MNLRAEPIRSRAYLDGARGETCKLRIAGVCTGGVETTVACHVRDRHAGRGVKASDICAVDGCMACHDVFDRRAKLPSGEYISEAEWLFYALRGIQETLENRVVRGIVVVPQDKPKPFAERKTPPRKPKELRVPVGPSRPLQGRSNWPPKGSRKIEGRNDLRRPR